MLYQLHQGHTYIGLLIIVLVGRKQVSIVNKIPILDFQVAINHDKLTKELMENDSKTILY